MKKYNWIVLTNCTPGTEDAFNHWYNEVHIPDLLRIPGIVGVSRGEIAEVQAGMTESGIVMSSSATQKHRFLAIYRFETDDAEKILRTVVERANTPEMIISEHLIEAEAILFEDR